MRTLAERARGLECEAITGMLRYLASSRHAQYTKADVKERERMLAMFLEWTLIPRQKEEIVERARELVVSLNELNRRCAGTLIESDQREAICGMIIAASQHAGYPDAEDFTEEWREW